MLEYHGVCGSLVGSWYTHRLKTVRKSFCVLSAMEIYMVQLQRVFGFRVSPVTAT